MRQPSTPIFGLLFSLMLLLIFALLFGGAIGVPGGGDYLGFLVPGMLTMAMMFGVEATTSAMARDARKGITDRFVGWPLLITAIFLPLSSHAYRKLRR